MSASQAINDELQTSNEYHVASFVAHAMIKNVPEVKIAIEAIDGAEVHGTNPEGKIVFTLESDSHKAIGKKIDQLRVHQGLINILPVYHQYENESKT